MLEVFNEVSSLWKLEPLNISQHCAILGVSIQFPAQSFFAMSFEVLAMHMLLSMHRLKRSFMQISGTFFCIASSSLVSCLKLHLPHQQQTLIFFLHQ